MTDMQLLTVNKSDGLKLFKSLINNHVDDPSRIVHIADKTIQHLNGSKKQREATSALQELEQRWYTSLQDGEHPDFDVYNTDEYLAESWACWHVYSRKYIQNITTRAALTGLINREDVIIDLGNGLGVTTAALKVHFPGHTVYGTNVKPSKQWDVASVLAGQFNFEMIEEIPFGLNCGVVFASEYFEHIWEPLDHLEDVLVRANPRVLIIANTFNSPSIGHFPTYYHDDLAFSGPVISRMFNKMMRDMGYENSDFKFWNNRPMVWVKQ